MDLIAYMASIEPNAVTIVDTFGSLMKPELCSIAEIFDSHFDPAVSICFHPHDNLLLAFSHAQLFIDLFLGKRNISIDSSLNGMGRAPGNLQTELILNYLNLTSNCSYQLSSIFDGVSTVVSNFKSSLSWGFHPLYASSAFYKVHRSYPEFLLHTSGLSLDAMHQIILELRASPHKDSYNESVIHDLLTKFV